MKKDALGGYNLGLGSLSISQSGLWILWNVVIKSCLATVLSLDSELLALDEPTDNLDPAGSRMLVERIQAIPQTKIIVTHHLPVALDLCERAILLYGGRKTEDLPMRELLKNRALLERFGFDADYAQWMVERSVKFQSSNSNNLQ